MDASTDSRRQPLARVSAIEVGTPVVRAGQGRKLEQTSDTARVAILMCTYNGERYLAEQLASFTRQTHKNWCLYVSDDSSQDRTLEILKGYRLDADGVFPKISRGPGRGFVANFLSLTCSSGVSGDYFAWSDQDDIWQADKLQTALTWLQSIPANVPALYCGRTQIVGRQGELLGMSPKFTLAPSFRNALVQSIAGGNTMVFNRAARELICEAGTDVDVPSHDWWLYQLISAAGGIVCYDSRPLLHYRQHEENVIGSNSGCIARLRRLNLLFKGRFGEWNTLNIRALERMHHRIAPENQRTLAVFKRARTQWLPQRALGMLRARLYRQTLAGNLGLFLATLLKKI